MASVKKSESKNILKHSVNDVEKLRQKERISTAFRNFANLSKEKKSNEKSNLKKIDLYHNFNFFKNNKFNTSNPKCNNNSNANFNNSIKNSNISYLENKIKNANLKDDKFTNTFNMNCGSQKLLANKINITNNSQINHFVKSNNANLNFSIKKQKDQSIVTTQQDINNKNSILYLSTEPEKANFYCSKSNLYDKNKPLLKNQNIFINDINLNTSNSNVNSVYKNFLIKNPHNNNVKLVNNNNQHNNNFISNSQLLINKLNKNSLIKSLNKNKANLSSNLSKNNINNTDININKTIKIFDNNSRSKHKTNLINSQNISNQNKYGPNIINNNQVENNNSNKIPKHPYNDKETYSSPHDFIEDFFKEIENYCNNMESSQNQNCNRLNILNIFDNIFKNIITGEKPMETLDIYIKKKLSNYSEKWKKFLLAYEKMSIKINFEKNQNPNYINNIDLSTKNVINHNHNITTAENVCFNEAFIAGKNCYQNLKNELEEKFTNLMKNEVNKIKIILNEKEKIIEDLQKQITEKNSFISLMQESLNILKSKDCMTSHSFLYSDNLLKENFHENDFSSIYKNKFNNNSSANNTNSNQIKIDKYKKIKENVNNNLNNSLITSFTNKKHENVSNTISNNNLLNDINSDSLDNKNQDNHIKKELIDYNNDFSDKYINCNEINNNDFSNNFINNKSFLQKSNLENKTMENLSEQIELSLYDHKQFIRDKQLLISENKNLFNKLSETEKLLNLHKEKEIKLMKVLFYLNKQGIPIDEIIQNQLLSDKSQFDEFSQINAENNFTPLESSKSMDSLMYLPITLTQPNSYTKPDVIPVLNLRNINNNYNLEYGSAKKPNNNNKVCITDPSYSNHINIIDNNCLNGNYLIEENEDYEDTVNMNHNHLKNKKNLFINKNNKTNHCLNNNNNSNTIHNDLDSKHFMQLMNKNTLKQNLKISKRIGKNLQFNSIQNDFSATYEKNGPEIKLHNVKLLI